MSVTLVSQEYLIGSFNLRTLAWNLSLGIVALGSWESDLGLGSKAGGTGLLRLGEPAGWGRVNPPGRGALHAL